MNKLTHKFVRKIPKLLRMKWVWFKHNKDLKFYRQNLGICILDRWVMAYYKGSVVVWSANKLHITQSDPMDNLQIPIQFDDYISRESDQ